MTAALSPALTALLDRPETERRVGPFYLRHQLGRGGFAPVWLAEERYDGKKLRNVAVKLFAPSEGMLPSSAAASAWRDKVLDEARAICRVEHPAVVRFYSLQIDDISGVIGLVMEHVPGRSLDRRLETEGPLSEQAALDIGIWLSWALSAVHHAGLIHRDVKPGNIIEVPPLCKLIDFGIAAAAPPDSPGETGPVSERAAKRSRAFAGTFGYIAPECVQGAPATASSDIYAIGATLFRLMTGLVPVVAAYMLPPEEAWSPNVKEGGIPAPRLAPFMPPGTAPSAALSELVDLLLREDVNERPRHAEWVARELERIRDMHAQSGASAARRSSLPPPSLEALGRMSPEDASPTAPAPPSDSPSLQAIIKLENELPEPLAVLCGHVRRAIARDDAAGTRGALADLGLGVLRYAFAIGMAALTSPPAARADKRGSTSTPLPTAFPRQDRPSEALIMLLRSAVRPAAISWCYLLGALYEALSSADRALADRFLFLIELPISTELPDIASVASMTTSLEREGNFIERLLQASKPLWGLPLLVSGTRSSIEPATLRVGRRDLSEATPESGGQAPGSRGARSGMIPPSTVRQGEPCVIINNQWLGLSPFLPHEGDRLFLPEAPITPGATWRALYPASRERRDEPKLDRAMRLFAGEDPETVQELCDRPPLVGREEVLSVLAREVKSTGVGFILLSGPLGIGRTRLLDAAVEIADTAGRRVLRVHGSPERKSPLGPLRRAVQSAKEELAGLGAVHEVIERVMATDALGPVDMSAALEAVEDALITATAQGPLLLAFDDIQWADAHSLALLLLLLDRARTGALPAGKTNEGSGSRRAHGDLLVVAAARSEPNAPAPLRALLDKTRANVGPGARHMILSPLSPEQAARVAQGVSALALDLERAVVRASGHVPFFIVHPLLVWRETGAIAWRNGAWNAAGEKVLSGDVPGAAALVEARLDAYFEPGSAGRRTAMRVLACAGLYGGGLGIEALLRAVGEEDTLEEVLDTLVSAGVLVVDQDREEYGFAQEMIRQASLNLVRQRPWFRRLHRALLDAIAEGPSARADAAFLATGYEQLGAEDQARLWLGRAMDGAVATGLFREAAEFGDRRAALAPDPASRVEIELAIVRALNKGRMFEDAGHRLDRLEERAASISFLSAPAGRVFDVMRRIYRLEVARGRRRSNIDLDAAILRDADALGDPVLRCEARLALSGVSDEEEALRLAGEAIDIASTCGDALAFAARTRRFELNYDSNRRDLRLAEEDLKKALAIAASSGSLWQQVHIEGDLAALEAEQGRNEAAILRLTKLVAQAEATGMRGELRLFLQNLSALLLRANRSAEAAEVAGRAADLATEAGDPGLRGIALSLRADALRRTGNLSEALACVSEAVRIQRDQGDRSVCLALLRRADILEAMGSVDDALSDVAEARKAAEQYGDADLALGALIWEKLRMARRGEISAADLDKAVGEAEVSGITLRMITRKIIADAKGWLSACSDTQEQ